MVRKTGQKKTCNRCLATLLQNELNRDVTSFASHTKPFLQQIIRLLTGLNVGGKTRYIAILLVLQQCCKQGAHSCCPFGRRLRKTET